MKYIFSLFLVSQLLWATPTKIEVPYTESEIKTFVDAWLKGWTEGPSGADKIVAHYHPEVFYRDPNLKSGLVGTELLKRHVTRMLTNHPNMRFKTEALYLTVDGFVLYWRADIPFNGSVIRDFRGVDLITLKDGLITRQENFFDLSVFRPVQAP